MTYQQLPTTEYDDWGTTTRSTPAHVRLTVVVGLLAALTAPIALTPAEFIGVFLIGAFLGAFVTMLVRSATGYGDAPGPEALSAAVHMAALGAVMGVAATVLSVTLGARGWAIAGAAAALYALARKVFAPVAF